MVGVAREAPIFAKGFDCYELADLATAKAFRADGYEYVGAYLEVLTVAARDVYFAAGLGIWLLSTAIVSGLSASVGDAKGAMLRNKAMALGVPPKVHVTTDLEDAHGDPVSAVMPFVDHVGGVLVHGGYQSALYLGAGCGLSGHQAFSVPSVNLYVRAGSSGIPEPDCGFAMWQTPPLDQVAHGHRYDCSIAGRDGFGRGIFLWFPS
jgi:hypothetical protein